MINWYLISISLKQGYRALHSKDRQPCIRKRSDTSSSFGNLLHTSNTFQNYHSINLIFSPDWCWTYTLSTIIFSKLFNYWFNSVKFSGNLIQSSLEKRDHISHTNVTIEFHNGYNCEFSFRSFEYFFKPIR